MRLATVIVALALSAPAAALDCIDRDITGALPADESVDQPINALVTVRVYGSAQFSELILRDEDDRKIAGTSQVFPAGSDAVVVFTPDGLLAPGVTYAAEVEWDDGQVDAAQTFTTVDEEDTEVPTEPEVVSVTQSHEEDEWGNWDSLLVDVQPATDANGLRYEVKISTDEAFTSPFVRFQFARGEQFTNDPCSIDEVALLDPAGLFVEVTAIDVAGNRSDGTLSEPREEGGVTTGGSGCSTSGVLGGLWLALPVLAIRRRR
jgi:hypothetical protein